MKVLLINTEGTLRGGEIQTSLLAAGLENSGCKVKVALKRGGELSRRLCGRFDCHVFRFESPPVLTPIALARVISSWRPDIIHAQTSHAHSHAMLGKLLSTYRKAALVVSRRTVFKITNPLSAYFKYRKGADCYIAISNAAAEGLREVDVEDERIEVIPSGIELERFAGILRRGSLKKAKSGFVVGCIGALEIEKGHLVLVDAASMVLRVRDDTRFVVFGDGSLKREIVRRIEELGIGDRFEVKPMEGRIEEVLSILDVFVLPSFLEGLSTALISALAAGLPIVAASTGGVPEVVGEDAGILVPPGDPVSLADAIVRLLDDGELRLNLGEKAVRRARMFDIKTTVERTVELYERVVKRLKEDE